jgi:hypothetical protein
VNPENNSIVFHGNLQQLLKKVETGEMIPKLQASHAPMCKFLLHTMSSAGFVMLFLLSMVRQDVHCTCRILSGQESAVRSVEFR